MIEIILSHPVTYVFLLYVSVVLAASIYQGLDMRKRAKNGHAHE